MCRTCPYWASSSYVVAVGTRTAVQLAVVCGLEAVLCAWGRDGVVWSPKVGVVCLWEWAGYMARGHLYMGGGGGELGAVW
jgi:hypothetical protein